MVEEWVEKSKEEYEKQLARCARTSIDIESDLNKLIDYSEIITNELRTFGKYDKYIVKYMLNTINNLRSEIIDAKKYCSIDLTQVLNELDEVQNKLVTDIANKEQPNIENAEKINNLLYNIDIDINYVIDKKIGKI